MEIERRTFGRCALAETPPEGRKKKAKGKTIQGYAAVFNERSEDLGGFREVILPGAFDRALSEAHDVRALINHNPDMVLGRTTAETLFLSIDERGLFAEILPPDTTAARDLLESIEREDITGMSFGFRTLTDDWHMEDGEPIRELIDLELFDVSPVAFPAYPQTQVSTRALARARALRSLPESEVPLAVNILRQKLAAIL